MRRLLSAGLVVGIAGALVLAGTGIAEAASYPNVPPPSTILPDTEWAGGTLTPDEAAFRKAIIQGGISDLGTGPSPILTRFQPLIRSGAAVGGFMVGAAIGAGTMKLLITRDMGDTAWDNSLCAAPSWLRDGYTVMTLGVGSSSCPQSIVVNTPNSDQPITYGPATLGGVSVTYMGSTTLSGYPTYCWKMTGGTPGASGSTFNIQWLRTSDGAALGGAAYLGGALATACVTPYPGSNLFNQNTTYATVPTSLPQVRVKNNATGAVGAMAPTTQTNVSRVAKCVIHRTFGGDLTSSGTTYTENDGFPIAQLQVQCQNLMTSSGVAASSITGVGITSTPAGGSTTTIADSPVPSEMTTDQGLYPDCFDGSRRCELILTRTLGTTVTNCFADPTKCANWYTATSSATTTTGSDSATYECRWGSYTVPIHQCALYQRAFTDPHTSTDPGHLTDPGTGTDLGTGTGAGTESNTGNSIDPSESVGTSTGKCMDTWFDDFNPIDWVMTPVKCALQWAFVPRQTVVDAGFTHLEDRWQATAVGGLVTAVTAWSFAAPSSSGCDGITVGMSVLGHGIHDFQILNACSGPLVPVAGLSTLVIGISAVLGAVVAVTRSIGGIVGARALGEGTGP